MTTLGKYELHEQLSKGGFGIVYRATDTSLGREVALKVLHPQLMVDETFVERFKKEAHILASLEHPNIVTIHELGEIEGRVFIAMRYLAGGNLQQLIQKEGPLGYTKSLGIFKQVCEGLQAAHEQRLVHRDIKPASILFDAKGNAVISDFGLARAVQLSGASSSMGIAGTPAYRAPELWRGKPPACPATDVYSLGCMLVEMLTGKPLFDGDTPDEILTKHLIDGPRYPEKWAADVPDGILVLIKKALNKEPASRQQDAATFLLELDELNHAKPLIQVIAEKPAIPEKPLISKILSENELSIELAQGVKMEFVRVPAGEFLMGSDPSVDTLALPNEQPQHHVYLDEYWIGKYPVTNQQYQVFVNETKKKPPWNWKNDGYPLNKRNHPVIEVGWEDARVFCDWASSLTKKQISLPTEAQWEKAARGTDGRIYPWGNQAPDMTLANYNGNVGDTTSVGSYPAGTSPYGAMDMTGNAWEWTMDWEGSYSSEKIFNPLGSDSGNSRGLRGGSWNGIEYSIRSAHRDGIDLSESENLYSFRCSLGGNLSP